MVEHVCVAVPFILPLRRSRDFHSTLPPGNPTLGGIAMKKLLVLGFAALTAVTVALADTLPVFNATLTVGKQNRFVLIGADGKPSSWLQIGDSFEGYKLTAYDAKENLLDLERDGKTTRIGIAADAAVAAGKLAATPATIADAEAVLNKMHFDRLIDKMMSQQKDMMTKMIGQSMQTRNIPPEARDDFIAFQKRLIDEVMSMMNPEQMKSDMTKIYSEVFTKQELEGLGAFYSTPVGEALTDKQPVVQQKMQELLMPRMAQMMPKISKMSQEFAQQQKAKRQAAADAGAPAAPAAPRAPAAPSAPATPAHP